MSVLAGCGGSTRRTETVAPAPSPQRTDSGYATRNDSGYRPRERAPVGVPREARLYVSDAQRRAVEDTVRKLINATTRAVEQRDAGALMRLYPDTGALSSVNNGQLVTSRDSAEAMSRAFFQDPNIRTVKATADRVRIDVLAPDAAAFTVVGTLGWTEATGRTVTVPHAWSGVFVNRGRRWVILQEHDSGPPVTPTQ